MDKVSYLRLSGAIFVLVSLAHLIRAAMALPIVIDGWNAPVWLSWVAFVIAGALGYLGWSLARSA